MYRKIAEILLTLIFIISVGVPTYLGNIKFFELQRQFFKKDTHLLFEPTGFGSIIPIISLVFLCSLIAILLICRLDSWPRYRKSFMISKKILIWCIVIIMPALYLSFFNYVFIKEEGIYYSRFSSLYESFYPWEKLEQVKIDGYIPVRNYNFPWEKDKAELHYILSLNDGKKINLYDTPYKQTEITEQIDMVHDIIKEQGIPIKIDASDYESITKYYSGKELKTLEKIFNKND